MYGRKTQVSYIVYCCVCFPAIVSRPVGVVVDPATRHLHGQHTITNAAISVTITHAMCNTVHVHLAIVRGAISHYGYHHVAMHWKTVQGNESVRADVHNTAFSHVVNNHWKTQKYFSMSRPQDHVNLTGVFNYHFWRRLRSENPFIQSCYYTEIKWMWKSLYHAALSSQPKDWEND